jgi:hypothetical protein
MVSGGVNVESETENHDEIVRRSSDREELRPVIEALSALGLYAYMTVDERSRWTVACDTDLGRIDVRVGFDGLDLDVWDTSPGLFWEEEDERRREGLERLARVSLPAVARGLLDATQEAWWDEADHGVGVRVHHELPFALRDRVGDIAREQLRILNDAIALLERRLVE